MRIAYVLGASHGGTGTHAAMLARECAARGMSVTGYGPAETGQRFFGWPGAVFVPVEIPGGLAPLPALGAVTRLRRLLRESAPDVVHAHGLRAGAAVALALGRGRGRRGHPALVVTVHNAPAPRGPGAAGYLLLERIVAGRADAVTWVSDDLGERMCRRGARVAGLALVPAPPAPPPSPGDLARARAALTGAASADLTRAARAGFTATAGPADAARAGAGATPAGPADGGTDPAANGRPVVLAAGRLTAQKGFDVLIRAAEQWRDRHPSPVLAIAGAGPLAAALAGQARAAGLTVRFLGDRDDVPALLAAADIVVVPSRWEGQPLIVQEALRAGTPLVASRTGGIPALTGEDAALLVPPGDAAALAAAVGRLLDDPDLRAKLAAAAAGRAAALPSIAAATDAAVGLYQRLAHGSSAATTA